MEQFIAGEISSNLFRRECSGHKELRQSVNVFPRGLSNNTAEIPNELRKEMVQIEIIFSPSGISL